MRPRMIGASLLAASALFAPGTALATSSWGEIVFQRSDSDGIVSAIGRFDAHAGSWTGFRYAHKVGAGPWSVSHAEGAGVSQPTFDLLQLDSVASQSAFDVTAASTFGGWFVAKSTAVRADLRDLTRRTPEVVFFVRTEDMGASPAATMADWDAMKRAADAGDLEAFDAAAEAAWGRWWTELSTWDADIVRKIEIDFTAAG